MADPVASWAVELEDRVSGPARNAAAGLLELKDKIEKDTKVLREMQAQMNRLKSGGLGASSAARQLGAAIAAQKVSIGGTVQAFEHLGGAAAHARSVAEAERHAAGAAEDLKRRAEAAEAEWGRLSRAQANTAALTRFLGRAFIVTATAAIALASAVVAATAALVRYGLAVADAHRNEMLHLEGLVAIRRMHGRSSASAAELEGAIARVSARSGLGRAAIGGYAESLNRMGLRGANLNAALEGMAISAAVGGEEAGRRFAAMAAGAARTGRSVTALADRVRATLGPIARRMSFSLGSLWTRLQEGIASIFNGPRVSRALETFLGQLDRLVAYFSEFGQAGRALRVIVEAIFPSLLGGAASAGPGLRRFFDRLLIAALDVTIAFLRIRRTLRSLVLPKDTLTGMLTLATPLIVTAAAALWLVHQGLSALASQLIVGVGLFLGFATVVGRVTRFFNETDWSALGSSITDGIVRGLEAGAGAVVAMVQGLALDAQAAFRRVMGIASPSRVFAGFGVNLSRGVATGVRAGAPEAERAVGEMVDGSSAAAAGGGRGPVSVGSIELHIHTAATDARGIAKDVRAELARVLEELGIELGAPA